MTPVNELQNSNEMTPLITKIMAPSVVITLPHPQSFQALLVALKHITGSTNFDPIFKLRLLMQVAKINRYYRDWVDNSTDAKNCWAHHILPHFFDVQPQTILGEQSAMPFRMRFKNSIMLHRLGPVVDVFSNDYQQAKAVYTPTRFDQCIDDSTRSLFTDQCMGCICYSCCFVSMSTGSLIFGGSPVFWGCAIPSWCGLTALTYVVSGCVAVRLEERSYRVIAASDRERGTNLNQRYHEILARIERYTKQDGKLSYFRQSRWSLRNLLDRFSFYHPGNLDTRYQDLEGLQMRALADRSLPAVARDASNPVEQPVVMRME